MNMNSKRQIISDIINELITITCFDYEQSKDKAFVGYHYQNDMTVNSIIKKCSGLCLKDYDFTILRDEVYATVFEVITQIADEYTEDELTQICQDINQRSLPITNQFFVSVYKLSILKTKFNLSGHRRCSTGMIPAFDYTEYNEDSMKSIELIIDADKAEKDICHFLTWFHENKHSFLTERQLKFIEDDSNVAINNHSGYRKRIYNNTLKAYIKAFGSENDKENQLKDQINTVEKILEAKDFAAQLIKHRDKSYILDTLTTYVSLPTMKAFNQGDRSYEVIKPYRIALFKLLNNLNQLLKDDVMSEDV